MARAAGWQRGPRDRLVVQRVLRGTSAGVAVWEKGKWCSMTLAEKGWGTAPLNAEKREGALRKNGAKKLVGAATGAKKVWPEEECGLVWWGDVLFVFALGFQKAGCLQGRCRQR